MRQARLAELLAADGHQVTSYAIDKMKLEGVERAETAYDAVQGAKCIILPLPVSAKDGVLNTPLSAGLHTVREILSVLDSKQVVCAGRITGELNEQAASLGLEITDYYAREEFVVLNALATAEGGLQLVMEETPITLCGAKCLVIGFGRIGKILCSRLRGMCADVTASARRCEDIAWIKALGYKAENTQQLDGRLRDYDIIINTVPARIMGQERLSELKKGCLCLDLASKPGGVDFAAASRLGVKAVWALSLPGEVAPVTSGAIIRDTVYNILAEKGEKNV